MAEEELGFKRRMRRFRRVELVSDMAPTENEHNYARDVNGSLLVRLSYL